MEIDIIFALKKHWNKNGITSVNSENDIKKILAFKNLILPYDFVFFFKHLNGTSEQDEEGFHFYKIENLIDMKEKFNLEMTSPVSDIMIFADYMAESWWYGIKMDKDEGYEIGIISSSEDFKRISNSFEEFINLYLIDSPLIYEFK